MSDTQSYFDNVIGTSFWSLNSNGVQLLCGTYISLLRVKNRFLLSQTGLCIHHACIFLLLHHVSHNLHVCIAWLLHHVWYTILSLNGFTSFMFTSFGSCTVSSTNHFCCLAWLVHPSGRTYLLLHHVSHILLLPLHGWYIPYVCLLHYTLFDGNIPLLALLILFYV